MERTLWVSPENERRKGRKPHLAATGLRRSAWRKLAAPLQNSAREIAPIFAVSPKGGAFQAPIGVTLAEIAEIVT
jgi:hypothetical protein